MAKNKLFQERNPRNNTFVLIKRLPSGRTRTVDVSRQVFKDVPFQGQMKTKKKENTRNKKKNKKK